DIDVHRAVPELHGHLLDRYALEDSGGDDHAVERTNRADGEVDGTVHCAIYRDIRLNGESTPSSRTHVADDGFRGGFIADVADGDICACPGGHPRGSCADSPAAPGYEDVFAC